MYILLLPVRVFLRGLCPDPGGVRPREIIRRQALVYQGRGESASAGAAVGTISARAWSPVPLPAGLWLVGSRWGLLVGGEDCEGKSLLLKITLIVFNNTGVSISLKQAGLWRGVAAADRRACIRCWGRALADFWL